MTNCDPSALGQIFRSVPQTYVRFLEFLQNMYMTYRSIVPLLCIITRATMNNAAPTATRAPPTAPPTLEAKNK